MTPSDCPVNLASKGSEDIVYAGMSEEKEVVILAKVSGHIMASDGLSMSFPELRPLLLGGDIRRLEKGWVEEKAIAFPFFFFWEDGEKRGLDAKRRGGEMRVTKSN